MRADRRDHARHLMARDEGVLRHVPVVVQHAQVAVTDAAVLDADVDVLRADGPEFVLERGKGGVGRGGGVSVDHQESPGAAGSNPGRVGTAHARGRPRDTHGIVAS